MSIANELDVPLFSRTIFTLREKINQLKLFLGIEEKVYFEFIELYESTRKFLLSNQMLNQNQQAFVLIDSLPVFEEYKFFASLNKKLIFFGVLYLCLVSLFVGDLSNLMKVLLIVFPLIFSFLWVGYSVLVMIKRNKRIRSNLNKIDSIINQLELVVGIG